MHLFYRKHWFAAWNKMKLVSYYEHNSSVFTNQSARYIARHTSCCFHAWLDIFYKVDCYHFRNLPSMRKLNWAALHGALLARIRHKNVSLLETPVTVTLQERVFKWRNSSTWHRLKSLPFLRNRTLVIYPWFAGLILTEPVHSNVILVSFVTYGYGVALYVMFGIRDP